MKRGYRIALGLAPFVAAVGLANRPLRHALTFHRCLFEVGIAPGLVLHVAVGIRRADDPELAGPGGHSATIMDRTRPRAVMAGMGVNLQPLPQAQRDAMRLGLEGQGPAFRDDAPQAIRRPAAACARARA